MAGRIRMNLSGTVHGAIQLEIHVTKFVPDSLLKVYAKDVIQPSTVAASTPVLNAANLYLPLLTITAKLHLTHF